MGRGVAGDGTDMTGRDGISYLTGPFHPLTPSTAVPSFPLPPTPTMAQQQHHSFQALNQTFVVDSEYQFVKELGQGAYGCVVAAKHKRTGEGCAIKKITSINTKVRRIPWHSDVYTHAGPLVIRGSSRRDACERSSASGAPPTSPSNESHS